MGESESAPKYTQEQKAEIINQIVAERSRTRTDTDINTDFEKYYTRFINGELTEQELQKYNGDWLRALKERDNLQNDDFLLSDGWEDRNNNIAWVNNRPLTDFGNAERLVDQANYYIRYCHQFASWYIYTRSEGRWKKDEIGFINRVGKDVI